MVSQSAIVLRHQLKQDQTGRVLTERAALLGQVGQLDRVDQPDAIVIRGDGDGALNVAVQAARGEEGLGRELGGADLADGVVLHDGGIGVLLQRSISTSLLGKDLVLHLR